MDNVTFELLRSGKKKSSPTQAETGIRSGTTILEEFDRILAKKNIAFPSILPLIEKTDMYSDSKFKREKPFKDIDDDLNLIRQEERVRNPPPEIYIYKEIKEDLFPLRKTSNPRISPEPARVLTLSERLEITQAGRALLGLSETLDDFIALNPFVHTTTQDSRVVKIALGIVNNPAYVSGEVADMFKGRVLYNPHPETAAGLRYDKTAGQRLALAISGTSSFMGIDYLDAIGLKREREAMNNLKEQVDRVNLCYMQVWETIRTGVVRDAYIGNVGSGLAKKSSK